MTVSTSNDVASNPSFKSGDGVVARVFGVALTLVGLILCVVSAYPILSGVLTGIGALVAWRGIRYRRTPYVVFGESHLMVYELGRAKHCIHVPEIAEVRRRLNGTAVVLRGGDQILISHSGFVGSEDAQKFRELLESRVSRVEHSP